jgi:hypothetical protein
MQDPMRLHVHPDIWADYDPGKVKQGLQTSAGALKGVDIEALKKDTTGYFKSAVKQIRMNATSTIAR